MTQGGFSGTRQGIDTAMKENQQNIQASILDRLIDLDPEVSYEPVQYRMINFGQVKASLMRDLENLLNTRRQILSAPAALEELDNSLFSYGLGDFTSQNPKSPAVRNRLRQEIERAVSRFEPRLKNVRVHIETPTATERNLKLRIVGTLMVDPVVEPVSFDTYFDVNRGQYVISK